MDRSRTPRLSSTAARVLGVAASLLLSGCALEPLPPQASCGPNRRADDGTCCPVFTRASPLGCVARGFTELETLGDGQAAGVSVAVDGDGMVSVAWIESDRAVVVDESAPGRLGAAVPLSTASEGVAGQVDLAAGPRGEALATWQTRGVPDAESRSIRYAERRPNDAWRVHAEVVSFEGGAYEPRVGIGPDGDRVLLWNQWTGAHYGVSLATSRDFDEPFVMPSGVDDVLSPPINFSNAPRLALGSDGELIITWYQATGQELMTFASERPNRSASASRPGPNEYISAPGAPVDSHPVSNPKVALAPSGQAAVVWTQEDGHGHVATYLATRDADGTWYSPRDLEDTLGARVGVARCAELAFGAEGDLFVVFEQDGASMLSVRGSDGTWLTPRGAPRKLSHEGLLGLDPHVAAGEDGAVVVAFREVHEVSDDLVVLRLTSGAVDLTRPTETIATGTAFTAPSVAIGGPDDRVVIGAVEHGPGLARVRLLSLD